VQKRKELGVATRRLREEEGKNPVRKKREREKQKTDGRVGSGSGTVA
jgi:hypothetical protein